MTLSRRSLITGLISLVAAPAIVRVSSLMPVKAMEPEAAFEWSPFYTAYPVGNGITRESLAQLLAILKAHPIFEGPIYRIVPPGLYEELRKGPG